MKPPQARKQRSGAAKMKSAGRKAVLLGVLPKDLDRIRRAAEIEMRPVSQFILFHAVAAADSLIHGTHRLPS